MKVGDYVRTKNGDIAKVEYINYITESIHLDNSYIISVNEIKETSPLIIDLIHIGDYVNGHLIDYIDERRNFVRCCRAFKDFDDYKRHIINGMIIEPNVTIINREIKSIVTKEQFSQMEYRIEE